MQHNTNDNDFYLRFSFLAFIMHFLAEHPLHVRVSDPDNTT